jgi:phenylalanyl-tRNA synthetase beta chain
MRLRLQACGIRPISNLVDVTNWILLELGHPLHAFDLDKLTGAIVVRRAAAGEPIQTLDGQVRTLEAGDIVIADARGPVAVAGVMGGASSEVTASTRRVLLEAATFDPRSVRRTSRRLGLISEASYRFERGVDAVGIPAAARRAAAMLAALGGGAVVAQEVDRSSALVPPRTIRLPVQRFERVAGRALSPRSVEQLGRIGVQVQTAGQGAGATLEATPPSFRRDLEIAEDLIEELLRLSDAYLSPPERGRVLLTSVPSGHPEALADRARDLLAALGLCEAMTWGFVPRARLQLLANGKDLPGLTEGVFVKNPISADYEVMRTSLLPGLADALARNLARGVWDPALFEVGPVVERGAGVEAEPVQSDRAAGVLAGKGAGWLKPGEALDFHDLKTTVEELLHGLGIAEAEYRAPASAPYLHPGVSADVAAAGRVVGHLGELHPLIAQRLGVETRAFYFELLLSGLAHARAPLKGAAPPRFPAVGRDVSFWIAVDVSAAAQRDAFLAAGEPLLVDLRVLEDYREGRHVPAGKKGMLWSLTYRAERTLTDAEADAAHARVVAALAQRFEVAIR